MPLAPPAGLTTQQTAIWLDQQLFPDKPVCNTGQALTIQGALRFDLFEAAAQAAVAEYAGLCWPPGADPPPCKVPVLDLRRSSDPPGAAREWMQARMREPFDLEGDAPLFRFALLRIADGRTVWFQKYHHLLIDATGRQRLSARVAAHYRALRTLTAPPLLDAAGPEDIRQAQAAYAASAQYAASRAYLLGQYASLPDPLIETDRRGTERARSGCHARTAFRLPRAAFARLDQAAQALQSSAFRAIIALVFSAFARLHGRQEITLGLQFANRPNRRMAASVGVLASPSPLRLSFDRTLSVADAIRTVDHQMALDRPHRRFPAQDLATALGLARRGLSGLFDVELNYLPIPYTFDFEGVPVELENLSYGFTVPWAINIADPGLGRDLEVSIDTDPGLVSPAEAARLAGALASLLEHGLDQPDQPIGRLALVSDAERSRLLARGTGEAVPLPADETVTRLCAAQAARTPDAVALICGDQSMDYATLHRRAATLARRLAALGIRPGMAVGVALPRTPDLIVAVLGILKAGAAYLALDPAYPAERIRFIIEDAAAPVIVTSAAMAPGFSAGSAVLLCIDEPAGESVASAEPTQAGPRDFAYILYTSGSTGRPKAVGITHRNLLNLLAWGRSVLSDAEIGGMLLSTSLNFDVSTFELFLPLAYGGCVVLVENLLALHTAPAREKVRLINTSPSTLDALLRTGRLPGQVSTVVLAGEKLSRQLARRLEHAAPGVRLLNCYGPTETTVYSSVAPIDAAASDDPPIGRPLWNTSLHVMDSLSELLPDGAAGELFIGGAGVAPGYLGRPELTAERFVANPFGPGTLYRTGDRVRWRSTGELEFLGRTDEQIKLNGLRIELGEIEAALLALPGIAAAAVSLREDADRRRLVAHLVPLGDARPDTASVRAALERRLPRHMVPSAFAWLDRLPMTPNGKIDRKALPAPPREEGPATPERPPHPGLETELAEIWRNVMQSPAPGAHADFFDLGGQSLELLNLLAAIEERFGRRLTVDMLAGGLTIAGLARLLLAEESAPGLDADSLVALQPLGWRSPFFCVHGIGGDVLHLRRLAMHMGQDRPVLGLRHTATTDLHESIKEIAARYARAVAARQPAGPLLLGGHSMGATIAYEMARQLIGQGRAIALLVIIDQRRPQWRLSSRNLAPTLRQFLANIPGFLRDEAARFEIAQQVRQVRRKLRGWLRAMAGRQADAAAVMDLSRYERDMVPVFESHLRAMFDYRPVPCPTKTVVFRAKVQPLTLLTDGPAAGWQSLVGSDLAVHVVPGNHLSMVTEPHVRTLAEELAAALDQAERAVKKEQVFF